MSTDRSGGFSLVEVLVSLTLLAMALAGLMAMQMGALRQTTETRAFQVAQDELTRAVEVTKALDRRALDDIAAGGTDWGVRSGLMRARQRDRGRREFDAATLAGLPGDFQLAGLAERAFQDETAKTGGGFDDDAAIRWRGVLRPLSELGGQGNVRAYAIRLVLDDDFLPGYPRSVVRALGTVFWEEEGRLQHLHAEFFVEAESL